MIKHLKIKPHRITATYQKEDKTIYEMLINEFGELCGCPRNYFNKKECKHLRDLKKLIGDWEVTKMSERRIKIGLRDYDNLTGGIPVAVPLGFTSDYGKGKTLLLTYSLYPVAEHLKKLSKPHNIVFIDTEKTVANNFLPKWKVHLDKRFKKKMGICSYSLDKRKLKKDGTVKLKTHFKHPASEKVDFMVNVITLSDIKDLQVIFGRKSFIQVSKPDAKTAGGQVTTVPDDWIEDIWETPIAQWLEEFKAGYLIIDSFTQAFTAAFGQSRQTYPGRHNVNMTVLTQLHDVCFDYDLVCAVTHHRTKDPANPRSKVAATGGSAVGYNFKEVIYIKGSTHNELRNISILRYADKAKGESVILKINDDGYVNYNPPKKRKKKKNPVDDIPGKELVDIFEGED
jgi:hypothetical protein